MQHEGREKAAKLDKNLGKWMKICRSTVIRRRRLEVQNIEVTTYQYVKTRDLPSKCLGLNYVYSMVQELIKKLDVITFPFSSSNRGTQRSNAMVG